MKTFMVRHKITSEEYAGEITDAIINALSLDYGFRDFWLHYDLSERSSVRAEIIAVIKEKLDNIQ